MWYKEFEGKDIVASALGWQVACCCQLPEQMQQANYLTHHLVLWKQKHCVALKFPAQELRESWRRGSYSAKSGRCKDKHDARVSSPKAALLEAERAEILLAECHHKSQQALSAAMQLMLFCLALSYILPADDINRGIARQSIHGESAIQSDSC